MAGSIEYPHRVFIKEFYLPQRGEKGIKILADDQDSTKRPGIEIKLGESHQQADGAILSTKWAFNLRLSGRHEPFHVPRRQQQRDRFEPTKESYERFRRWERGRVIQEHTLVLDIDKIW